VIWRFIEEELVEGALDLGPPEAEAAAAAAPLDIAPVFQNNHALQNDIFYMSWMRMKAVQSSMLKILMINFKN
jgi:hypothetical protein